MMPISVSLRSRSAALAFADVRGRVEDRPFLAIEYVRPCPDDGWGSGVSPRFEGLPVRVSSPQDCQEAFHPRTNLIGCPAVEVFEASPSPANAKHHHFTTPRPGFTNEGVPLISDVSP
jgi:hypothetical protein